MLWSLLSSRNRDKDVVPIDPFEFLNTLRAGLFSEYGQPVQSGIYEVDGLQLAGADSELLINFLRVKYNPDFRTGSSILYRFHALEKLLTDNRSTPFVRRTESSFVVHEALVAAAAILPLEGDFAFAYDRAFLSPETSR